MDDGGFLVMSNKDEYIDKVGHWILLLITKLVPTLSLCFGHQVCRCVHVKKLFG